MVYLSPLVRMAHTECDGGKQKLPTTAIWGQSFITYIAMIVAHSNLQPF